MKLLCRSDRLRHSNPNGIKVLTDLNKLKNVKFTAVRGQCEAYKM